MASESPLRPNVLKGALAVYPNFTPGSQPAKVIVFQYNPEQMRRQLANRTPPVPSSPGSTGTAKEDVLRVAGPPVETITLAIELNAADQLADPDSNAQVAQNGLNPTLATLELLMYPPSQDAQHILQQANAGAVQVNPADVPLVLLIWGVSRVVPVKITSFAITEDLYDTRLNPVKARVDLGLQVLTYLEFPDASIGRDAFIAYQQKKEALAASDPLVQQSNRYRDLLPP
jgi:hypothetical protein